MNKAEFFRQLNEGLKKVSNEDRAEIIAEYEDHFRNALAKGKSEEQICADLGPVEQIVTDYRIDKIVAEQVTGETGSAKSIARAALVLLALAPLNFILFFGPFMFALGVLIASWAISGALFFAGVGAFGSLLMKVFASPKIAVLLLGCMGVAALGVFLTLLLIPITQMAGALIFKYLKWNLDFARGKQ